jgi:hypothetical protein
VTTSTDHSWKLIAPWYRWPQVATAQFGTASSTRPDIQKFTTDVYVDRFVHEPQRSYQFSANDQVELATPSKMVAGSTAKLFLPTHDRLYLVASELVCVLDGLPAPAADKVCQRGLVVRRSQFVAPAGATGATRLALLKAGVRIFLAEHIDPVLSASFPGAKLPTDEDLEPVIVGMILRARIAGGHARDVVDAWLTANHASVSTERWSPTSSSWEIMTNDQLDADPDRNPIQSIEQVDPMYQLASDGTPTHDAVARTMFFGAVPTGSTSHDAQHRPRFDSHTVYQLRCFVRRHDCRCPRRTDRRDCHGEVVWSEVSEPFQLASPSDPIGNGQRKVTVELPNVKELQTRARGGRVPVGVRLVSPPGSGMKFPHTNGIPSGGGSFGDPDNCFFAIPLITLVATFVLGIFMTIVMFVFQAWWMLKLRFCLSGLSIDMAAGVLTDVETFDPTRWAAFKATGSFRLDHSVTIDQVMYDRLLALGDTLAGGDHPPPGDPDELVRQVTPNVIEVGGLLRSLQQIGELPKNVLTEETRVERAQVGLA